MLVLAIMVIIGSMAAPALTEVFERQKVRGAANTLRVAWDEARLQAMRTGQAQVFRCEVEGTNYSITPLVLQSDAINASAGSTLITTSGQRVQTQDNGLFGGSSLQAAPDQSASTRQLEKGITFVSCQVAGDMRAYNIAQQSQSSGGGDVTTMTVGQAVIFYPDGSTSTAEVRVRNERGDVQAVQVRGLTGHSRVVEVSFVPSEPSG